MHVQVRPADCTACTHLAGLVLTCHECADCQAASSSCGAHIFVSSAATAAAAAAAVTAVEADAANPSDPTLLQHFPAAVNTTGQWQQDRPAESDADLSDAWEQQPGMAGTALKHSHHDSTISSKPDHPHDARSGHSRSLLSTQQAFASDTGSHDVQLHQPMDLEESASQNEHSRSLLRRAGYKRVASQTAGSQAGGIWQGSRKRVSRRLDATGGDTAGDPRGAQQSIQDLVGKQRQRPTQNRTEFEREQLLLKAHFRLDIGEGLARSKSLGPRAIPRGLQPAQGFFDGATHQVSAHPHQSIHCSSAVVGVCMDQHASQASRCYACLNGCH